MCSRSKGLLAALWLHVAEALRVTDANTAEAKRVADAKTAEVQHVADAKTAEVQRVTDTKTLKANNALFEKTATQKRKVNLEQIVTFQIITNVINVPITCVQGKRRLDQEIQDDLETECSAENIHPRALRFSLSREMAMNAILAKKIKYYELQLAETERNREKDKYDDRLHTANLLAKFLL